MQIYNSSLIFERNKEFIKNFLLILMFPKKKKNIKNQFKTHKQL